MPNPFRISWILLLFFFPQFKYQPQEQWCGTRNKDTRAALSPTQSSHPALDTLTGLGTGSNCWRCHDLQGSPETPAHIREPGLDTVERSKPEVHDKLMALQLSLQQWCELRYADQAGTGLKALWADNMCNMFLKDTAFRNSFQICLQKQ